MNFRRNVRFQIFPRANTDPHQAVDMVQTLKWTLSTKVKRRKKTCQQI